MKTFTRLTQTAQQLHPSLSLLLSSVADRNQLTPCWGRGGGGTALAAEPFEKGALGGKKGGESEKEKIITSFSLFSC